MSNITKYLQLLIEITDFEIKYLKHINKIALFFYYLLLPTFMAIAALAGSEIKLVLFLACLILLDPALVYCYIKQQRLNSLVHGFTAMVLVELRVYLVDRPLQQAMRTFKVRQSCI